MLGLAQMAATLAEHRFTGFVILPNGVVLLASRENAHEDPKEFPCSAEYYHICDRITRGEKP